MLQKNTKTQDFQEIGEDIFVKDTFLAVFVQKSGRTVTFLYEIGYFMGIYENTWFYRIPYEGSDEIVWQKNRCQESIATDVAEKAKNVRAYIYVSQASSCIFHKKIDKKLTFLKTIDSFYYLGYNCTYTKISSRQETAIF